MARQFSNLWWSQNMAAIVARGDWCCSLYERVVDKETWDAGVRRGKRCWTTIAVELFIQKYL